MRSIRRRLLTGMLAGFALLLFATGTYVFKVVQRGMIDSFDAQLNILSSDVRYLLPEGTANGNSSRSENWVGFFEPDSGQYFEVWDELLLFSDPSPSLQGMALPYPEAFTDTPQYAHAALANGEPVRTLSRQFEIADAGPEGGYLINVVVALNRIDLDAEIRMLLITTLVVGLAMLLASALLVHFSVHWGLRPLMQLDRQVAGVDASTLDQRFEQEHAPRELGPIVQRLNELMDRLETGFDRERRFNADLAHELRTPVAELKTLAEVALQWPDQAGPENYQDVLEISDQLQRTIETLLLLTRAQTDATGIAGSAAVPLRALIENSIASQAAQASARNIAFEVHVDAGQHWDSRSDLLEVIVNNLVSNAAAYAPEGSTVSIALDAQALVFTNPAPDLDAADVEKMFDRLWRKDPARSASGHTGLGLTLAHSCAETLGLTLKASHHADTCMLEFRLQRETPQ